MLSPALNFGTDTENIRQMTGKIIGRVDKTFYLGVGSGECKALRAASCLLEPEKDDLVLFASTDVGRNWILAVLERARTDKARMEIEGDVVFRTTNGRLSMVAEKGLDLACGEDISLVSRDLNVNAAQAEVVVQKTSFVGGFFHAQVEKIKLFADYCDQVVERLHQRLKRSYRIVEDSDTVRAGRIDQVARHLLNLRGENAVVTARELVKVDGEQIHIG